MGSDKVTGPTCTGPAPSPLEVLAIFEEVATVVDRNAKDCDALGTALLKFFEVNKARLAAAEAVDQGELDRAFEGPLEKRAIDAVSRIQKGTDACEANAKVKAAMKNM